MTELETLTRPGFLDRLDRDPDRAGAEFERYLHWFVATHPPHVLRGMSPEDRADVTQDVMVKCLDRDFRVLRGYVSRGNPFAAWLYFVVRSTALDLLRKSGRELPSGVPAEAIAITRTSPEARSQSPPLAATPEAMETLRHVGQAIAELDQYCRLLVKMAAREFRPREMARVLRWPDRRAKKISDDLRYCREKLRRLLTDRGVDPGATD